MQALYPMIRIWNNVNEKRKKQRLSIVLGLGCLWFSSIVIKVVIGVVVGLWFGSANDDYVKQQNVKSIKLFSNTSLSAKVIGND